MPDTYKEESLDGAGGLRIFMRSWRPQAGARAVVVLSHYRGRGRSDGERYFVEKFSDYQGDLDLTVKPARAREPGLHMFIRAWIVERTG